MTPLQCPHCQHEIGLDSGQTARFCPFCGKPIDSDSSGPSELEQRLSREKKPQKRYAIIEEALAANPDDFEANKALLFHGRLHQVAYTRSGLDFSIIKCHLIGALDPKNGYNDEQLDTMYEELLSAPQLQKTMALSGQPEIFFAAYIHRLSFEYIDLFLRGDSRYNTFAFGFNRSMQSVARRCAPPVRRMLQEVQSTPRLSDAQRLLFAAALREGYARVFSGYEAFLYE